MSNWRTRLREADPLRDGSVPPADVDRVRHAVVAEAQQHRAAAAPVWRRPLVVAAAAVIMLAAAAETVRQRAVERKTNAGAVAVNQPEMAASADDAVEQQQLQFATPGGTRIIWVFDSRFEVKGTKQ
jgi:hypothetical protein